MNRILLALVVATPLALAAGCDDGATNGDPADTPLNVAKSALERDTSPDVPAADLAAAVAGNNAFALDLYREFAGEDGNLVLSPHSVSVALAMTYAGAAGNTATEMADALHFDLPQAQLHPAFNALDLALSSRGEGAQGADGQPFRLRVVNAAWAQHDYSFLDSYLDALALNYGAGVRLMDFATAPDPSRLTINAWVSEQTETRIPNLLPEGSITSLTRLVLTNAVYFNAAWETQFDEDATASATFHAPDGDVQVPTMTHTETHAYAAGDGWTAAELRYDGGEVAMLIVMPDDLATFEAGFDAAALTAIDDQLGMTRIDLHLPKFEYRKATSMVAPLGALGIADAFTAGAADFSGMNGGHDLYITGVLHEAFIKLDEHGTEAAAATAVVVGTTSIPPDPITVRFDQPFLYLIRDVETGAILFVGRVVNPAS
ncbi:MAG: serpin family protein [Deltaproteobacteria bacterium]|nr:MAG: serpin family protein [Deltaproteobacteria bacterium]